MKHLLQKLRFPIVLLLASLLLGSGLFLVSLNSRLKSEARLIAEKSSADESARAVREAPARLIEDRNASKLYRHILESGFIGEEDRVGWISALAQTRTKMQLASLSWRMTPQASSPLAPDLFVSNMEFTASSIDPQKLRALIEQLRTEARGRFTIERCALELDRDGIGKQATCRLNWWTLSQHGN